MNMSTVLSIVVPTHNRCAILRRNLAALNQQTSSADKFEVLVVADSCQDDTVEMVSAYTKQAIYRLRLLSHGAKSAGASRNLGAANAQGTFLLFLDDDVVAQPNLVSAHMNAQRQEGVALGYSKPILPGTPSWWQSDARRWWEDTYMLKKRPGHRFSYRDFFSGNVSISNSRFRAVGGFDTAFSGRLEDYELGLRLLKVGVRFRFVPDAVGYHYDSTDLHLWLSRIRQEGEADIQIGQRHPELRNILFGQFTKPKNRWELLIRKLAFAYPQGKDCHERWLLKKATICEHLRLRGSWKKILLLLREYNYWRGAAGSIGGWREMINWLQEAPMPPAIAIDAPSIDIANLPPAEVMQETLHQATSKGARLLLENIEVLTIEPQLGMEPLREEHLYCTLRELAQNQFVPAMAIHMIRSNN